MGRAVAITRTDIFARALRFIAKRTRDGRAVRRIEYHTFVVWLYMRSVASLINQEEAGQHKGYLP
jgi:hypothetical protein